MLYVVADKEFEDVRLSGESWEKYKQGRLTSSSLLIPMVTGRVLIVLSEERMACHSDGLSCGNRPSASILNDSVLIKVQKEGHFVYCFYNKRPCF